MTNKVTVFSSAIDEDVVIRAIAGSRRLHGKKASSLVNLSIDPHPGDQTNDLPLWRMMLNRLS